MTAVTPSVLECSFTYGYGGGMFNPSCRSDENQLWCRFTPISRAPGTFRDECIDVARRIGKAARELGRTPCILLSGGMDSEIVVRAFLEAGEPFTASTFRFADGLNLQETYLVERLKRSLPIKHTWYDINVSSWLDSNQLIDAFRDSHANSVGMVGHMCLLHDIWFNQGGLPVMGTGDLYLENYLERGWHYVEMEKILAWHRFATHHGILAATGFFQFTSEIMLSIMSEPKVQWLISGNDAFANAHYAHTRHIKNHIYRKHWPEVAVRPKWGGKELVWDLFKARSRELLIQLDRAEPYFDSKWTIPANDFMVHLTHG